MISLLGTTTIVAGAAFSDGSLPLDRLESLVNDSVSRVGGTLEVRGTVVATAAGDRLDAIQVPVAYSGSGRPVSLDPDSSERLLVSYRDGSTSNPSVPYTTRQLAGDGDGLLEPGELFLLTVRASDLTSVAGPPALGPSARWTIELVSPVGGTVDVTRTLPFVLQPVMALH
jgi:hypothetical protein